MKSNIRKLCAKPNEIISVPEIRSVRKVQYCGCLSSLDSESIRMQTLDIYTPDDCRHLSIGSRKCFCQMCRHCRGYMFMRVNSIERAPKYFFSQLRLCLCLDCSKKFELLRNNSPWMESFLTEIRKASIQDQGIVVIKIKNGGFEFYFTATHLAEIQEILKLMPNNDSDE